MIQLLTRELLQVLAKKGRIDVIRVLKAYPDHDFTINDLARTARMPAMTAWRAVWELKDTGLVRTRKIGNAVNVRITEDRDKLRTLRLIPDTDPQRSAAKDYAARLGANSWLVECRLFGSIGRGEHSPGDEVDVAVVFDQSQISEAEVKRVSTELAATVKEETNVSVVPLCVSQTEMGRKGGLASELRDKETIWRS